MPQTEKTDWPIQHAMLLCSRTADVRRIDPGFTPMRRRCCRCGEPVTALVEIFERLRKSPTRRGRAIRCLCVNCVTAYRVPPLMAQLMAAAITKAQQEVGS